MESTALTAHTIYFDDMIHDHLLAEDHPAALYEHTFFEDAHVAVSEDTQNTTTWD